VKEEKHGAVDGLGRFLVERTGGSDLERGSTEMKVQMKMCCGDHMREILRRSWLLYLLSFL